VSTSFSGGVATVDIPGGAAGSSGVPATIANLVTWIESDDVLVNDSQHVDALFNQAPNYDWPLVALGAGAMIDATLLNGLPVLNFPGSSDSRYDAVGVSPFLPKCTIFLLFKATSFTGGYTFLSGATGALELRISGTGIFELLEEFVASIGTSSSAVSAGVWTQANATYDSSTGAFAFRIAKAAAGSGTNAKPITARSTSVGYDKQGNTNFLNAKLAAVIVYDRVLSSVEIAAVEAYLTSKWGV
jgi:hypothetical protein